VAKAPRGLPKLSGPAKGGACAGLIVAVFAAYYFLFHLPVSSELTAAVTRHSQLERELGDAKAAEKAYQEDLATLAESDKRQREFQQALPSETEYPAFLSAVQSAANLAGVSLAAWTPRKETSEEFFARVPMKVELAGRFHQIARFFFNVGQLDRIINMEDIAITDPKQQGDDVMLRAEVLATAFHAVANATPEAASPDGRTRPKGQQ
jgi:type IV pilus assembly protein PilO